MFVNPKEAIEKGWITFPEWMTEEQQAECIQPNGIDITLDHVYRFNTTSYLILTKNKRQMRDVIPVDPQMLDGEEVFHISGNMDFMSDFYVKIPEGIVAELIVRSTLNRNDIFVTSGLWDQGFIGNAAGVIRNSGPTAYIAPGTRIAQLKFIRAESNGSLYDGSYQNIPEGQHWAEAQTENEHPTAEPQVAIKEIKSKKESK